MKIPEKVQDWLDANGLRIHELLNLAFVPRRTFEGILDGSYPSIAARRRLFLITGLDFFKLNESELGEYLRMKSKPATTQTDISGEEKISSFLTERWKKDKVLPSKEESLMTSPSKKQDKIIVRGNIFKKYFPTETTIPAKSKNLQEKIDPTEIKLSSNGKLNSENNLRRKLFNLLLDEITDSLQSDKQSFQSFCKANASQMKQLQGMLNIILNQDDPQKAYLQIKDIEKHFKS